MSKILSFIAVAVLLAATARAEDFNAVRCEIKIGQWNNDTERYQLIHSDTADFLENVHVTGFATGVSLDIETVAIDSSRVTANAHAHTFAGQPDRKARNLTIEYGLPASIDDLIGKNGCRLRVTITPLEPIKLAPELCPYIHYTVEDFAVDPTAHTNLYYVPQTLGDFYWNTVKGLMEEEYESYNRVANFSMPGKYLLYLCPCKLNSIIWDDRFGMMVDPVRSTMFSIFTKEYNSTYPFLISQAALYHNFGYAPAFVSEGGANYFSFAIFDMKRLLAEGNLPELKSLLDSYTYMQTDPRIADRISATFVTYLIGKYGFGTFLDWYRAADDLNQLSTLEETYGKSVEDLESEWLTYVDTVSIKLPQASHFAFQAEAMLDYKTSLDYGHEMLKLAKTRIDSMLTFDQLSRTAFFAGEFYEAADYQAAYLKINDSIAGEWMKLGGYQMMNGDYEQAAASLERASTLDPASGLIEFNRGMLALNTGDTTAAMDIFREVMTGEYPEARIESRLTLAVLLTRSEDEDDRKAAETLFREGIATLGSQDRSHNTSSTQMLWLGIAYLGIGDTGNADDHLRTALYLDTRPFYEGMIYLWLGKVADVRGERELAKQYYNNVLNGASAVYHKTEAKRWLQEAYRR